VKKILISLMAIALVIGLVGAGAFAYFSDTETSTGNTFTAGSLDLVLGPGTPVPFSVSNLAPGDAGNGKFTLTNTGSLPGELDVKFANFLQFENSLTEPELNPPWGTHDYEAGPNAGELNFFLGFVSFVDVDQDGVFDQGLDPLLDIQLVYNGQQAPFPGFWGGDFHYAGMSSNLIGWDDVMTLQPNQSVDVVILWQWPGAQAVDEGNYSHNIAQTDGLSFDILTSLEQVGGNGGVAN